MAGAKAAKFVQKMVAGSPAFATRLVFRGKGYIDRARPYGEWFWTNAKVEMAPPVPADIPAIKKGLLSMKNTLVTGKFMNLTVKEATANVLVLAEIAFFFYVGEIIGKRSLVGYKV